MMEREQTVKRILFARLAVVIRNGDRAKVPVIVTALVDEDTTSIIESAKEFLAELRHSPSSA